MHYYPGQDYNETHKYTLVIVMEGAVLMPTYLYSVKFNAFYNIIMQMWLCVCV